MQEYKQQLVSNTIWNAIESYSMTGIQLICTFLLARFLTPSDFGIIGMLVVFTTIAQVLVDSGFGAALIREKNVSERDYSSVFYLNLAISIVLYIILFSLSGLIAKFYHQDILKDICSVTFLSLPLQSLSLVQIVKLKRELKFKKLCIISLSSSIIASVIAIISASYFRNVWALVIQNIASVGIKTLLVWIYSKWSPSLMFSWLAIKKYFSFAKNLMLAGVIGAFFNNIYSLLIGRFYTPSDLGYYSQASRMRDVSSYTSTGVIQNVTYPILAKVSNDGENLKNAYQKVISVTLIFVGCIVAILMTVAMDIFEVLMGSTQWRISGFYFLLLGVTGILYPLHAVNQNILMVKGESRTLLMLEITRRSLMIVIIFITVNFGITVFVFGNSIYSILLLFLNLFYCGKPINYTLKQQLKDVAPILLRQVIIISIGLLISYLLSSISIYLRILLTLSASIIVAYLLFNKNPYYKEMKSLLLGKLKNLK